MVFTLGAHAFLMRLPAYQAVVRPFEASKGLIVEAEIMDEEQGEDGVVYENEPFLSGSIELQVPGQVGILHIAKTNILYNFAVAYVFVITLVSPLLDTLCPPPLTCLYPVRLPTSH